MNENWKTFFMGHRGAIIGILAGLIVGILILTINFWRTLLLGICVFVGYFFGWRSDHKQSVMDLLDKLLRKMK